MKKRYFVAIRKNSPCMWVLSDVLAMDNDDYRAVECASVDAAVGAFVVLTGVAVADGSSIPEVYVPVHDVGFVVRLDNPDNLPLGFRERESGE